METSDYIEKHFTKGLSDSEHKDFEQKVKNDREFSKEVKEHVLLLNSLDEIKAKELIYNMGKIEAEIDTNETSKFHPMLKWVAVFAFMAMSSTWFFFNEGQSSQELFDAYYTIYPNVEQPAIRSDANQQGAWRLYTSGDYEDAYLQFQHSLNNGNNDEASWFYLGVCAIELSRFNQAEQAFEKVIDFEDGRYMEQAEWYLALSYLKAGEHIKAKKQLKEIEVSSSSYSSKANELLLSLR